MWVRIGKNGMVKYVFNYLWCMAKRLVSMDMMRGWAILLMVVFHVFLNVSELVGIALSDPFSLPIGQLILVAFIAIFIHWQSLFLLISAIVHWYTMTKMLEKGQKLGKIFLKQLIFGIALYIFGFLREPFLSPWGMTGSWFASGGFLEGGTWNWNLWTFIYRAETLTNLGFSIIITSVIFTLLALLNKTEIKEKYQSLIKIGILTGIACLFLFIAPLIQNWVTNYAGTWLQVPTNDGYIHNALDINNGYYNRWLLNSLAGREFPIFPNYTYFLVGCIIGVLLSQSNPHKRILLYTGFGGLILTLFGAYYWIFLDMNLFEAGFTVANLDIGFHVHPTGFVIFSVGLQMIIITLALRFYEFNPKMLQEKRKNLMLKLSRWIRRWGMFALTIFTLNVLEIIPRGIGNLISDANFRSAGTNLLQTSLVVLGTLVMWEGILRLICLSKGYASSEFVFLALFKLGKKPIKNDPLNLQGNLIDVEPISFVPRG